MSNTARVTMLDGTTLTTVGGKSEPKPEPQLSQEERHAAKLHAQFRAAKWAAFEAIGKVKDRVEAARQEVLRLEAMVAAAEAANERLSSMDLNDWLDGTTQEERVRKQAMRQNDALKQARQVEARETIAEAERRQQARALLLELNVKLNQAEILAEQFAKRAHNPEEVTAEVRRWYASELEKGS